jgi:hypothetical protein
MSSSYPKHAITPIEGEVPDAASADEPVVESTSPHDCCHHPVTLHLDGPLLVQHFGTCTAGLAATQHQAAGGNGHTEPFARINRAFGAALGASVGLILVLVFGPVSATPVHSPHLFAVTHTNAVIISTLFVLACTVLGYAATGGPTRPRSARSTRVAASTTPETAAPAQNEG